MKNLKTILEVKGRVNSNDDKAVKTVSISLNDYDINNVLFTLAYAYKNDEQAGRYKRERYKTLYTNIYKDATKTLGKETLIDEYGLDPDINKVQTRY